MDEKRPNSDPPTEPPDDGDDELTSELVAYLDGELDPQGNEVVEARIGIDATVRAEADALKKTWDLLDYLPRTEPSPSFTERTISRIEPMSKSGTNGPSPTKTGPSPSPLRLSTSTGSIISTPPRRSLVRRLLGGVCFLIALGAAGVAGYFIHAKVDERLHRFDQQEQDAKILSERPLLQNLQHYRYVDDLNFLKDLDNPELFGDENSATFNEASK